MKELDLKNRPIGFFDSGVGGLSVMKKSIELMPNENYIYYGDSKNSPYGVKSSEEVSKLTFEAVQFLVDKGCKAIVVACNTATSAAIVKLREAYKNVPIIGIEPALKPAAESNKKGKIVVMATPMTLSEKKFKMLMDKYNDTKEIVALPCAGLVEFIEKGILEGDKLHKYLQEKLMPLDISSLATIVLGCTHYPFVKNEIQKIAGEKVNIIDGSLGTSNELKRKLQEKELLNLSNDEGEITIYNSSGDYNIIALSYDLIEK